MNEDFDFDALQGRGESEGLPQFFPELASINRGVFHRPTVGGIAQASIMALEFQNEEEDSPWNDPNVVQDYLY